MKEQRVIKFRVILNDKIIGYEKLTEKGWQWMCPDLNPDSGLERWIPGVFGDHSPYKRDQFTGLHDKAGNGIYEGDLIRVLDRDWPSGDGDPKQHMLNIASICEVVYDEDRFVLVKRKNGYSDEDLCKSYGRDLFEVIGNVHQHKHLIE